MKEEIELHGMVLSSSPIREFDKRLTLLTAERGKLTVWASGAKKSGSAFLASTRSFVFGDFSLSKGRSGFNLSGVKVREYFDALSLDPENACYASYFVELADYEAQEELPAKEMLSLIFLSLKALLNQKIDNLLVRRVYELRMMKIVGEYLEEPPGSASPACVYTWKYVLNSPLDKLYTFILKEAVLEEFSAKVAELLVQIVPCNFKSLEVLDSFTL